MSGQELLSVIDDLCRKILFSQCVRPNQRNLYNPLKNTEFRHRKTRWFPDPMVRGAPTSIPQPDFAVVRQRLAEARDGRGSASLNVVDINRLDRAWETYENERSSGLRVSERTPKHFDVLTKEAPDLKSVEGLAAFLYDKTYKLMLRGESRECSKALRSIYSAFENRNKAFGTTPVTRTAQRELLLLNAGFCLRRLSDDGEVKYVNEMKRRLNNEHSQVLLAGVLTHGYMMTSDPQVAQAHVDLFSDNSNSNWWKHFHHGIDLVRAAHIAVDLGFVLSDRPSFLGGLSVGGAFNRGLDVFSQKGRQIELSVLTAISLSGIGASGDLDAALDGILAVRKKQSSLPNSVPQLEAMLLLAEARAFFAASGGTARNYLFMAGSKFRELQEIRKRHPSLWVRPGALRFIGDLKRASIDKLGTATHMGL